MFPQSSQSWSIDCPSVSLHLNPTGELLSSRLPRVDNKPAQLNGLARLESHLISPIPSSLSGPAWYTRPPSGSIYSFSSWNGKLSCSPVPPYEIISVQDCGEVVSLVLLDPVVLKGSCLKSEEWLIFQAWGGRVFRMFQCLEWACHFGQGGVWRRQVHVARCILCSLSLAHREWCRETVLHSGRYIELFFILRKKKATNFLSVN